MRSWEPEGKDTLGVLITRIFLSVLEPTLMVSDVWRVEGGKREETGTLLKTQIYRDMVKSKLLVGGDQP